MKVGIYGDSFAVKGENKDFYSWVNFLEDYYTTVDCYGIPGSPLFKSVDLFNRGHQDYDKIVFVVTNPFRYELIGKNGVFYINNPTSIDVYLEEVKPFTEDYWMLKNCKRYLGYPNDGLGDIYQYAHYRMVDHIRDLRSDALIIPAFQNSFVDGVNVSLEKIQAKEIKNFNLENKYQDHRVCHLSTKNNKVLAEHVHENLKGNLFPLSLDNFFEISKLEFSKYFTRK